jgi:hypothetical protein
MTDAQSETLLTDNKFPCIIINGTNRRDEVGEIGNTKDVYYVVKVRIIIKCTQPLDYWIRDDENNIDAIIDKIKLALYSDKMLAGNAFGLQSRFEVRYGSGIQVDGTKIVGNYNVADIFLEYRNIEEWIGIHNTQTDIDVLGSALPESVDFE